MKKVICFTIGLGSGGAERQLVFLATMLKESGYEVKVLTYLPDNFYKDKLDEKGIPHQCIDNVSGNWRRLWTCKRIINEFNADVVIAYLEMPAFMACLMKLIGGKFKLIISERNTTQKKTWFDKIRFPLMKFADWIVPNSFSQAHFIEKEYPRLANKIKTITNFVDTTAFSPRVLNEKDNRIILTAARITPQKNIIKYIEAISRVITLYPNIVVKWYGSVANEAYYKECQNKIKELHLENSFFFEPPTSSIVDVYRTGSVFCLPSLFEGYPNVICEAMSCGLPILCSNICDNPLIIEDGINGFLFDPLSEEDIALKIKKVLELSDNSLIDMSNQSRNIALKKFSSDSFKLSYLSLVESN